MIKNIIILILKKYWLLKCSIQFWIYGSYGVCNQLKKAPYPFIQPILVKYGAKVGKRCVIDTGLTIHRPSKIKPFINLEIHDDVYLGHDNLFDLSSKITIMNDVAIGARCQFWTHTGDFKEVLRNPADYKEKIKPVIIEEGTIIYSNVLISAGIVVGQKSRIGAGSVIIRDTESGYFYGGVPAKKVKQIDKQFNN